jgi:hypothetical protein
MDLRRALQHLEAGDWQACWAHGNVQRDFPKNPDAKAEIAALKAATAATG